MPNGAFSIDQLEKRQKKHGVKSYIKHTMGARFDVTFGYCTYILVASRRVS